MPPFDRPEYEREVAAVRAQLGDGLFAVTWAEGRAMSGEAMITYAMDGAASSEAGGPDSQDRAS